MSGISPGEYDSFDAYVDALIDRIEQLEGKIENANQAMSETSSSWESRCHHIMNALGEDYGPSPEDKK